MRKKEKPSTKNGNSKVKGIMVEIGGNMQLEENQPSSKNQKNVK